MSSANMMIPLTAYGTAANTEPKKKHITQNAGRKKKIGNMELAGAFTSIHIYTKLCDSIQKCVIQTIEH